MTEPIDMIRVVPETAVRLYLGAKATPEPEGVRIELDNKNYLVDAEVYDRSVHVARALNVRQREVQYATDVLELRHDAEEIYLEALFEAENVPKILFVPAGSSASAYYRAMMPAHILGGDAKRCIVHFTERIDLAKALRYDVLWIQLLTGPLLIDIAKKAKEAGVKLVYDVDDRLDSIPAENQAIHVYGTAEMQAQLREMMLLADAITVSTEPLAEYIRSKVGAKDVRVLPNLVMADVLPVRQPSDPSYVRILWAGSPTHKRDLAIIAPALREILLGRAGKVRFTLFGEKLPEELIEARAFIDLKTPVDFEEYPDALSEIGADFAIAPLEDNAFNVSKSAVKALEFAGAGYPMLLSPVGEYPAIVDAGFPAELVPLDGWKAALERMIGLTRDERTKMGGAALEWVRKNRNLAKNADQWLEVARDLVACGRT